MNLWFHLIYRTLLFGKQPLNSPSHSKREPTKCLFFRDLPQDLMALKSRGAALPPALPICYFPDCTSVPRSSKSFRNTCNHHIIVLSLQTRNQLEKLLDWENSHLYNKLGLRWKLTRQRCDSTLMMEYVSIFDLLLSTVSPGFGPPTI